MEVRAAVLSRGAGIVEEYYESRVEPVEQILAPYHHDGHFVRTVSVALVAEGERVGIDPRALASVLLVENPWLDPHARSSVGAVGLMQVMPFHAGRWGCSSSDLTDIETNVCHGARIFAAYLEQHAGDVDRALLAYNGCVRGTNTPQCHLYPNHVYSRAGRMAMRYWLDAP
jgi:soluble lytic murein transglycosylase-like protein